MRYSTAAAAIIGAASANVFTTIDPCPAAPTHFPKITVTKQYQPVSFCVPESTCDKSVCKTKFPMTTSVYVSTVIPCAVSGTSASSCTVTKTDQEVPCSVSVSTITSVKPIRTTYMEGTVTKTGTSYSSSYEYVTKKWNAKYDKLGPLAIPGYEGSGLCKECDKQSDGSRSQEYEMDECRAPEGKQPICQHYEFYFKSMAAPSATAPASAVCSSEVAVHQPGTYVYTFPQVAPGTTWEAEGAKYTVPPQPWFAHVTRTAYGPTTFYFTVTVTKTITYHVPQPQTPKSGQQTHSWPQWGDWPAATTTPPSKGPDPTWGSWPSQKQTTQPWNPPMTTTGNQYEWGHWPSSTGAAGPQETKDFLIKVVANGAKRFRKRSDDKYVGFAGGDDSTTVDYSSAAAFHFDQSDLKCGSEYINSGEGKGYIPFEKGMSSGHFKFFCLIGTPLTLPGASFCVKDDTTFITWGSAPGGCTPVELFCVDKTHTSTTASAWETWTTSTTTASEWESWTTTTTTSDVSADLDVPDPTPEPGTHWKKAIRGMRY